MQIANPAVTQSQFEDSPPISTVLRAPNLLVRESLAGVITALALILLLARVLYQRQIFLRV